MALPAELAQMETDFLSGRNPLAYIPLCHALRRQKQYMRALELCQRGLAGDQSSVAGRTLYARLLSDLGHYEDSLREIGRAEAQAPDAMGLLTEKARCLLRLKRYEAAEQTLQDILSRNPLDPEVQLLNMQFRQLRGKMAAGSQSTSRESLPRMVRLTNKEILEKVLEEMRPQIRIISCAVIPTGAGEPALEGDPGPAETGYSFFKGVNKACRELNAGCVRVGLVETESTQLIILVRKNTLVALCIEPTPKFGKIYHRFQTVVSQLLPEAITDSSHPERSGG